MTYKQHCNSTKQHNKTQNIVITYKIELIKHNITQYNVLYHIVKYYHTKYDTPQYFSLKYILNILQNTTLFQTTPYHDILQKNTTSYIDQSKILNNILILHNYIHQTNYIIKITFESNK